MHLSLLIFLLLFGGSLFAGVIGSLVGLGGGVLLVPMLTLAFGLPIQYAIGTSIVAVIATSSGSAAAYVRDHLTNMRIGLFLEMATTLGAVCGALLAGFLVPNLLFLIFGVVLFISAVPLVFKIGEELPKGVRNDRWANWLHLSSSYPDRQLGRVVPYHVTRTPVGLVMMYVAGVLSGLLGIGGTEHRGPLLRSSFGYSADRVAPFNFAVTLMALGSALIVLGLTRRRSREFLDAMTEAVEER